MIFKFFESLSSSVLSSGCVASSAEKFLLLRDESQFDRWTNLETETREYDTS